MKRLLMVALFSSMLAACGGGSSSSSSPSTGTVPIEGAGVKGPLANAQVNLFALDYSAADLKGTLLDEGETASTAAITGLAVPAGRAGLVMLEFIVDADTIEINTGLAPVFDRLVTVVDVQRLYDGEAVYASPLTTLAVDMAIANADEGAPFNGNDDGTTTETEFADALEVARRLVTASLGFGMPASVDIFTTPPLITNTTSSVNAQAEVASYRQAIEAVAALSVMLSDDTTDTDTPMNLLQALAEDLSDGDIDGESKDGVVPAYLSLSDDVDTQLDEMDLTTIQIPGTTDLISDIETVLVDEKTVSGVTTDTTVLEDGTVDVEFSKPELAPDISGSDAEVPLDTDGDGIRDELDSDDDNDGVLDSSDAFPLDDTETVDTDGDGIGNNADTDDDNDGVLDNSDTFPLDDSETVDTDGDGIGNNADTDDDNDGVIDTDDAFPLDNSETVDTDGDGVGNNADTDDDNDSVLDTDDAFPLDDTESIDTDGDGVGNNADTDDDNDGVNDSEDAFPFDATESKDTDGDGTGDNSDAEPYPEVSFETPVELYVAIGEQIQNPAQATPSQTFVYDSSDDAIATVDSQGRVTGVSSGSVTISAYISGTPSELTTQTYTANVYEACAACTSYLHIIDESDYDLPVDMVEQGDGKVVVLSRTSTNRITGRAMMLTRFDTDGTLDTSFGTAGHATYAYAGMAANYDAADIALQSSGKILVLGDDTYGRTTVVSRFNTDGSLDTTFGTAGHYEYNDGTYWNSVNLALDDSDNIVFTMNYKVPPSNTYLSIFHRLSPDGVPDISFDSDGMLSVSDLYVEDSLILDDGKILATGNYKDGGNTVFAVMRINQDGSVDSTFGTAGLVTRKVGRADSPHQIQVLSDGNYLVTGITPIISDNFAVLWKMDTSGNWDTSFSGDSLATMNFNGTDSGAYQAIEQADGKIAFVGHSGFGTFALGRVNADGSFDTTLPLTNSITAGAVTHDIDYESGYAGAFSVLRRRNGGYLLMGYSALEQFYGGVDYFYNDIYLIGLDINGQLDNTTFVATGLANEVIADNDNDGIRDRIDRDDDQDGIFDEVDTYPFDTDNDGIDNDVDPDDDGDGINDTDDAYPFDLDNDGILNVFDPDDDGDGVDDSSDAFPYDPTEQDDTDGDGIGNNADPTPYPVLTFALSGDQTIGLTDTLNNAATPASGTHDLQYSSSDTDVATVDAAGVVTAVAAGTATISVDLTDWPDTPVSYQLTVINGCPTCASSTALVDVQTYDAISGVIELADSDLLVYGFNDDSPATAIVSRLNLDGTPDTSFNSGSPLEFTYAAGKDTKVVDAVEQSDGKILLLSEYTPSTTDFLVTRLNADGSFDTSYGTSGHFVLHDASGDFVPGGMVLQSDGALVVAGSFKSGPSEGVVIRLTSSGALQAGFGYLGSGMATLITDADLKDVVLDGDDIVATGTNAGGDEAVLIRMTSTGELDTTFNTTGIASLGFAGEQNRTESVIVQSTGQYVINGSLEDGEVYIARFNDDGSLDNTFGASGISREGVSSAPSSVLNESFALIEQTDGILALVGGSDLNGSAIIDSLVVWRFDADGVIDSVVSTSLGYTNTYMTGMGVINSTYGGLVIAVDNYRWVEDQADLILYGLNNDGTENTTRFQ